MAASKPILGVLETGSEVCCLIEDTHGGLCCEPGEYDKVEENIYGVLQNLQTFSITNKERTELKICETVDMETLLSAGNIDKCQLDCMILAQKSKATIMYILKGKRGSASYPMCF